MATIQPLTTLQITSMDQAALQAYSAQLSAAISTAMDTSGYTYEALTSFELDLLSPSELYSYSINFSTLRAIELYNKSLIDTAANIATYQAQASQSTLQGISTINYSISLAQAATDVFTSTSRALQASATSTIAGLDIEISQNSVEIAAYDSTLSFNQSTITASNQIIREEIALIASPSTISSMAAVSTASAKRSAFYTSQAAAATSEVATLDTQLSAANAAALEATKAYKQTQYDFVITNANLQAAYYTASMNANISAQSDITIEVANHYSMWSAYGYKEAALLEEAATRRLALKTFTTSADPLYISTMSSVTRVATVISSCKMLTTLYSTIIPLVQQVSTIFIDRSPPFLATEDLRNQIAIASAFIDQKQAAIKALVVPAVSDADIIAAKAAIDAAETLYDAAIEPELTQIEQNLVTLYAVYNTAYDTYTDAQAVYNTAMGQILPLTKEIDGLNATVLDLNRQLAEAAPDIARFDVSINDIRRQIVTTETNISSIQTLIDAGISAEVPLTAQPLNAYGASGASASGASTSGP